MTILHSAFLHSALKFVCTLLSILWLCCSILVSTHAVVLWLHFKSIYDSPHFWPLWLPGCLSCRFHRLRCCPYWISDPRSSTLAGSPLERSHDTSLAAHLSALPSLYHFFLADQIQGKYTTLLIMHSAITIDGSMELYQQDLGSCR